MNEADLSAIIDFELNTGIHIYLQNHITVLIG